VTVAGSIGRIAGALAAVSVMVALAGVAQAGTSRPQGMSQASYRAQLLRSEALNERYGLGAQRAVTQGMTAAAYGALMLRSEALNAKYGLDRRDAASVGSHRASSSPGFAWGAFGIGAVGMFGLALLAGAVVARRQLVATLRGLTPRYRTP